MLHANIMALCLQNWSCGRWKFYIARIGIFDFFAPVTLTLTRWPSYTNLIRIPWRYTGCANMIFLRQGFRKLSSDRQTRPKLYTTTLCGWSNMDIHVFTEHSVEYYRIVCGTLQPFFLSRALHAKHGAGNVISRPEDHPEMLSDSRRRLNPSLDTRLSAATRGVECMQFCKWMNLRTPYILAPTSSKQGWARDVKARDRDETVKFRDETFVCSSRDVKVQFLLIGITGLDVIFHVNCF